MNLRPPAAVGRGPTQSDFADYRDAGQFKLRFYITYE